MNTKPNASVDLSGPWISGCILDTVPDIKWLYVRASGPDVNIANVMPDDIIETAAPRCGLGVISLPSAVVH
jgi:hypothetical protein